ncbi:MAG: hypothetical protein EDM74_13725 [Armatimonadetes bacterium]|nr:MAG: hypothetical protein EDM74_13725 [Armatimonadota bacterium]
MTPTEYAAVIESVTAFIECAAIVFASMVAAFGIDAWRREHVGKRRLELAEEALTLFYQARDVITMIRSPMGYMGEGSTRKSDPSESPEVKEALDKAYVAIERYNEHVELFGKIRALKYRFMAQFGVDESKSFDEMDGVINEIFRASRQLGSCWKSMSRGREPTPAELERIRKWESVFWSGEDPDVIDQKVDALVKRVESTNQQIVKGGGTLFGILNVPLWK